jgi:RHS repeat-associated protein
MTTYEANNLNQYTQISVPSVPSVDNLIYDLDGNLLTNGVWSYAYDAENRLIAAYSNNVCVVSNAYDHMSRRVLKVSHGGTETRRFVYDGWNLVLETISTTSGTTTNHYVWGKDLSGTMQGAGGVGGLLAVWMGETWYFPLYDANGNITAYVNEQGVIVAEYVYDAYGGTIAKSGSMADAFAHRFSTKYYDAETDLYYYGYRFYDPVLHRWLNRDPSGERMDDLCLYAFVVNNPLNWVDLFGLWTYTIGPEKEPPANFDEDFVFDPNSRATIRDRLSLAGWRTLLVGAETIGHLADATRLYRHYLSGSGMDMPINYEKAFKEDENVRKSIHDAIVEAQKAAESLAASNPSGFSMCSDAGYSTHYPSTENWQKAIGDHLIWGYAVVDYCKDEFEMSLRLHELDRYNFNRGAADLATGLPDNANGRFATLGWAKSFLTRGTVERTVSWKRGDIPGTTRVDKNGRSRRDRGRGRERP